MQPLNPFLRAFFASKLPSQCAPASQHVLLVPATEFLLTAHDSESNSPFADLVQSEDFLSSHVLRIPAATSKDWLDLRDGKTKAKQYTTLNGRSVIIKDVFVYSNKGFKNLNQAQILHDELYHTDSPDTTQWLLYYISKPLLGTPEPRPQAPATSTTPTTDATTSNGKAAASSVPSSSTASTSSSTPARDAPKKREIHSFHELLNAFPLIARQMQPGLDRLFKEFIESLEQHAVTELSLSSSATTLNAGSQGFTPDALADSSDNDLARIKSMTTESVLSHERNTQLRSAFETLVLSAVDIFQSVDKQQLSLVGDVTNLSGPLVERMIEKYMVENVHETHLFPRVRAFSKDADYDLENSTRHMADVDISQVGIGEFGGPHGKRRLLKRLSAGVEAFQKMNAATSPQEMIDALLSTEQFLTSPPTDDSAATNPSSNSEKTAALANMNADVLVSLLLMVVVRSQVRHLHARLSYMRDFVIFGDVESGQTGYALSTLEAVLIYLSNNSGPLRKIGRANRALWNSVKNGSIKDVQPVLDPDAHFDSDTEGPNGEYAIDDELVEDANGADGDFGPFQLPNGHGNSSFDNLSPSHETADLRHVDPYGTEGPKSLENELPKAKKRVSMDMRSLSSSSEHSFHSRTSTISSVRTIISGETTAEQLIQTQDPAGNSVFMMAVESRQHKMLSYLLQLSHIVSPRQVLDDRSLDGVNLLSAAAQLGDKSMVGIILDYVLDHADDDDTLNEFLHSQDVWGRSIAHYCFNVPYLIPSIGHLFPWRQKDRNGQTPLFAMCRSYDHEDYRGLVESALMAASKSQSSSERLNVDDHVDAKGNTLLHIANEPRIIKALLFDCNSDPNASNDKHFTPLMVASKFARSDSIRVLFNDPRIDLQARDLRGLTAAEVAKDDEVRNRIDDFVLLLNDPMKSDRTTTIVRSFFVEDGTVRMIIKSGAANGSESIIVTTCRRSLADFENLARWLSQEHPASWMPSISNFRSPFQIIPRPSKQVLRDIQLRLDRFLQTLLKHTTFATHEMVWEFFLVPDIDQKMLADRAKRKAEIRVENLREEYEPLTADAEISEVEIFTGHAIDQIRHVQQALRAVLRRVNAFRNISCDLAEAQRIASSQLSAVSSFAKPHTSAYKRYTCALRQREYAPHTALHYTLVASISSTAALLAALSRPTSLIGSINSQRHTIEKHRASSLRSQRWPSALGLLDDTRSRLRQDAEGRIDKAASEMDMLGRELRYTRTTVASELAGWHEEHARDLKEALRGFAKSMVVIEKDRLEGMKRAVRRLQ